MEKRTLLLAQALITLMMASSMSGIMSLIVLGPTTKWLVAWPKTFVMAWPIAFCLTLVLGPLGFFLARKIMAMIHVKQPD